MTEQIEAAKVWEAAFEEWALQPGKPDVGHEAATEVIAKALAAHRIAGEQAVVAWLREQHDGRLVSRAYLAERIERGEHLKDTPC